MILNKPLINSFLEMYNSIMFKKIGIIHKESLSFDEDISPHIETILSHSKELYFHKSATDAPKDFPQLSKNELGDQSDFSFSRQETSMCTYGCPADRKLC